MTCLGLNVFPFSNLPTWTVNSWSKRLPRGKAPLSKPYGLSMPSPNCVFGVQGLETLWCSKFDHLDSFGSSSVGRMFWAEMVRLYYPSARHVFHLPQSNALVGKDAKRPFISLALPPATPGYDWSHVPPLQNTQHPAALLDTVLSPRKMEE
ncbi:hypothetical protein TNCV_4761191 [Trichonephila clavipes]|uniref:Uncharacterized protein n=1 Tax=Trichonephila clavipes TaxID=2585209 RepID=A0A8X6RMR4_TRICX|nr:hypothetical protein TNCV_4761191 [Trichonephila clavipes]